MVEVSVQPYATHSEKLRDHHEIHQDTGESRPSLQVMLSCGIAPYCRAFLEKDAFTLQPPFLVLGPAMGVAELSRKSSAATIVDCSVLALVPPSPQVVLPSPGDLLFKAPLLASVF